MLYTLGYEQAVAGRLMGRPHLIPVFTNAYMIPQRLREYNPAYYVVLNVVRVLEKSNGLPHKEWTPIPPGVTPRYNAWYEVRKLTAPYSNEQGVIIPFGELDARAIPYVLERDTEIHGDSIWERMDAHNKAVEAQKERQRKNLAEDIARDSKTAIRLDTWGQTYFGPRGR